MTLVRVRPIQDDYLVLSSISNHSIYDFLSSIWSFQGGNLFPYALNAVLLSPAKHSVNFIGIQIYCLATVLGTMMAELLILKMLLEIRIGQLKKIYLLIYVTLMLAGFEGMFVPSFVGAFSFSLAAIAHLWPVILMTIAIYLYRQDFYWVIVALPLGIAIGNSNAAESFSALIVAGSLLANSLIKLNKKGSQIWYCASLFIGNLVGFLMMVSAPGFSYRAKKSVGFPADFQEFFHRFLKAGLSFTIDSLTHPASYLAFGVGIVFAINHAELIDLHFRKRFLSLIFVSLLLICCLIAGGSLAYTSWHQALGVDLLVTPVFFFTGIMLSKKALFQSGKFVFFGLFTLCLTVSLFMSRIALTVYERFVVWDKTFHQNICLIHNNKINELQGAEIRYPPLQLGIEDIQTWPWMKSSYISWMQNLSIYRSQTCAK
jgi:hypothetical protein